MPTATGPHQQLSGECDGLAACQAGDVTSTSDTDGDKGHFLPQSPKSVGELESSDRVLRVAQPLHSGGRENRRTMVGWKCLPQEQLTLGQALGSFQEKTPLGLRVLRTSWACCTHPARTMI